jgi:hypothetical protein
VYFKKSTAGRIIPQVLRGNRIPGQLSIFVVLCEDADMNNNGGRKRIYPSTGFGALPDFRTVENYVIYSPGLSVDENSYAPLDTAIKPDPNKMFAWSS